MAYVNDVFGAILLGGTLGLVGQGARVAVGLKKMNDTAQDQSLGWSDIFVASRLVVSLIIGFLAGVAGMPARMPSRLLLRELRHRPRAQTCSRRRERHRHRVRLQPTWQS